MSIATTIGAQDDTAHGPAAAFDQAAAGNVEARKLESYPALDWLRMVLAGLVALSHSNVVFPAPIDGHFAVEVFLALSGWLIGGILIRSDRTDLPRFFFNRATRIWLPFAFAIVLLYGLAIVREGFSLHWAKYLFYDVTFTHYTFVTFPRALAELPLGGSGNQFWSLSVEEQFYLVTPLLMFAIPGGRKWIGWAGLAILGLALQSIVAPITLGVLAAIVQRDQGDWHLTTVGRAAVIAATIAFGIAAHLTDAPPLRALFATGIVLALAFPGRRGPIGLFLGAISFPFYLNHWAGGFILNGLSKHVLPLSHPVFVVVAFAMSFAISAAAWWLVDRPVLVHRLGWYSPAVGRNLAITAYALVLTGLAGGILIAAKGG